MVKELRKIFYKEMLSIKMLKWSKPKMLLMNVLSCLAIMVAFLFLLSPIWLNANKIKSVIPLDIGYLILIAGFLLSTFASLLSSFGFVYSSGYLDKNLENYMHLPISQKDFVNAKVSTIYINVLKMTALMMLPSVIIAISFKGFDIVMILTAIFYTITVPVITTYIALVIVGTLLYFLNKLKNKSIARNTLYGASVIFSVSLVFSINIMSSFLGEKAQDPTYILNLYNSLMDKLRLVFIYFTWAIDIFTKHKYINILWMILVILVGYISVLYFQKIYYKGALGFATVTNSL